MKFPGSLAVVTAPSSDLVSLTLAKSHLRVDITDDDTLISAYISAASELIGSYTGRSFATTTYDYFLDDFPRVEMFGRTVAPHTNVDLELPNSPVASVTSIKYLDTTGAQVTLDPSLYQLDLASNPARLRYVDGSVWPQWPQIYGTPSAWPNTNDASWPDYFANPWSPGLNSVVVRYVAGGAIPKVTQQAALLLIGDWYSNREADSPSFRTSQLPPPVAALLNTVKIRGFY